MYANTLSTMRRGYTELSLTDWAGKWVEHPPSLPIGWRAEDPRQRRRRGGAVGGRHLCTRGGPGRPRLVQLPLVRGGVVGVRARVCVRVRVHARRVRLGPARVHQGEAWRTEIIGNEPTTAKDEQTQGKVFSRGLGSYPCCRRGGLHGEVFCSKTAAAVHLSLRDRSKFQLLHEYM